MRPDSSPDPAVETLEELADVGAFVILAPTPQERIKSRNQFLGSQRCRVSGSWLDWPGGFVMVNPCSQSCRPVDVPLRQSTAVVFNPIKFCSGRNRFRWF
jgi:hypothetical protein